VGRDQPTCSPGGVVRAVSSGAEEGVGGRNFRERPLCRTPALCAAYAPITPKWLSARLRTLEADGIVTREVTGEREVRYRLTPKGEALEPVFDALLVWGMDYALGSPRHGEAIHPGRAIDATVRYLNRRRVRAARRVVWVILFGEDRSYTIRFDGARWSRQRGAAPADVTVQTSPPEWVKFLSADPKGRRRWLRQQRAAGTRQRLDELMTSFGVLQQTLRSREPGSQRAAMAKN